MSGNDQKFSDRVSDPSQILSVQEIEGLGFEWPKHALIKQFLIMEGDKIDLPQTLERMQYNHARHKRYLDEARALEAAGSDDPELAERATYYAQMESELRLSIAYLKEVLAAAAG